MGDEGRSTWDELAKRVSMGAATVDDARAFERSFEEARHTLPGIALEPRELAAYLATRIESLADARSICLPDVILACRALAGDALALARIDTLIRSHGPRLASIVGSSVQADELVQQLRAKLLLSRAGREPRLAEYSGRGRLERWLRVVATRHAISARRALPPDVPSAETTEDDRIAFGDPETLHLLERHTRDFKEAFADAFAELEAAERMVLRYYFVERLTIDELAPLLGLHRVSASRRVHRAREALVTGTRRLLAERLSLDEAELGSLLALLRSQVGVTLERVLAPTER